MFFFFLGTTTAEATTTTTNNWGNGQGMDSGGFAFCFSAS
jgi:hypothetical protein